MSTTTIAKGITSGLRAAMEKDPKVVLMGEDIGKLDEALENVTYFYNREVNEAVDRLQTLIEPAMTVILGLILGWVMLAVLGPVYDTISKMKF